MKTSIRSQRSLRISPAISTEDHHAPLAMRTDTSRHAIACAKQRNGTVNIFDPNSGNFEATPSELERVLSGILASFQRDVQHPMQQQAAAGNAYAVELSQRSPQQLKMVWVMPAAVVDDDSAAGFPNE
ncbi:YopT-type cysteine protease domain-containing protein [Ralstonia sp. 25C]|uniref:YopT-type cysteine protease domain-containing protein n=1 Tax=Ralstonia sp. 25C TaxID=3447363 RepID=UPI003F75135D